MAASGRCCQSQSHLPVALAGMQLQAFKFLAGCLVVASLMLHHSSRKAGRTNPCMPKVRKALAGTSLAICLETASGFGWLVSSSSAC